MNCVVVVKVLSLFLVSCPTVIVSFNPTVITNPTSIVFWWRQDADMNTTDYTISHSIINSDCSSMTNSNGEKVITKETVYELDNLHEGSEYKITIRHSMTGHMFNFTTITSTTVPSESPVLVNVKNIIDSTGIDVQWGPVPCAHQNGIIMAYSVRYGQVTRGAKIDNVTVDRDSNSATLMLEDYGTYFVQVAGVNDAGIGVYSQPVFHNLTLSGWPNVTVTSTTSTSIFLSFNVPSGWPMVANFDILWGETSNDTPGTQKSVVFGITGHSYNITELKPSTNYAIVVTTNVGNLHTEFGNIHKDTDMEAIIINQATDDLTATDIVVVLIIIAVVILSPAIIICTMACCCWHCFKNSTNKICFRMSERSKTNELHMANRPLSRPRHIPSVSESIYEDPFITSLNQAYNQRPRGRDPVTSPNEAYVSPTSQEYDYIPQLPMPRNIISLNDPRDEPIDLQSEGKTDDDSFMGGGIETQV